MKKKVLTIAVMLVMLATMLPVTAMAATANEKKLNAITAENFATYDTGLPTKGKKKSTKAKVNALLGKLPYKPKGSGTSWYSAQLSFYRNNTPYTDLNGNSQLYSGVYVRKGWSLSKEGSTKSYYYSESTPLLSSYEGQNMNTQRSLYLTAGKKYTNYYWEKGATTGTKQTGKSSGGSSGGKDKRKNFYTYADQTVLGQKCMVYSYQEDGMTFYLWVARKTGQTVKRVYVYADGYSTNIYFENKKVSKPASFYTAPKSVKFTTNSASAAEVAEATIQAEMFNEAIAA
ncbi:MAG: hypothetical protein GXY32_03450 [Ruminococcaceae bacterium]|nr:hypothetical protein [Oscillospiraceae bacterium]